MDARRIWIAGSLLGLLCAVGCAPNNKGSDIELEPSGPDTTADVTTADTTGEDTRVGDDTATARDGTADGTPERDTAAGDTAGEDATDATRPDSTDAGGPTWTSFGAEFFDSYCVDCHGADDSDQDYRKYDEVKQDADTIRCGVAPTALEGCSGSPRPAQFPVGNGPKPSEAERQKLVAWIDAGLPRE